ncbi:MAG: hypothetical protein WKF95_14635 [Rubrobacter sp.]
MGDERRTAQRVARHGKDLYERNIRSEVEPKHEGRFLALDVESGDYEVGDHALPTSTRLRERKPEAVLYLMRVGRPAAFRLGGRNLAARS